jgi:hypothetical protein
VIVYDCATRSWLDPVSQGFPHRQRINNSTVVMGSCLWLFGGMNQTCECYNDMDVFDTDRMRWATPTSVGGTPPPGRHSHTATRIGADEMWVRVCELYCIILTPPSSHCHVVTYCRVSSSLFCPVHHSLPTPHLFIPTSQVLGGTQDPDTYVEPRSLSDVHVFNFSTFAWREVAVTGEAPPDLVHHTATAVADSKIFVMGGRTPTRSVCIHFLDTDLCQWNRLRLVGATAPIRRIGAVAAACGDRVRVRVGCGDCGVS